MIVFPPEMNTQQYEDPASARYPPALHRVRKGKQRKSSRYQQDGDDCHIKRWNILHDGNKPPQTEFYKINIHYIPDFPYCKTAPTQSRTVQIF
jgi:hypothetical protein